MSHAIVYSLPQCMACEQVKQALVAAGFTFDERNLQEALQNLPNFAARNMLRDQLERQSGAAPVVLIDERAHFPKDIIAGSFRTRGLNIYLAGRYQRRKELCQIADTLKKHGHYITSSWLSGEHEEQDANATHEEAQAWANADLTDIDACDVLIFFGEAEPEKQHGRGGRFFELGYAWAKGKKILYVGQHEANIFTHIFINIDAGEMPAILREIEVDHA